MDRNILKEEHLKLKKKHYLWNYSITKYINIQDEKPAEVVPLVRHKRSQFIWQMNPFFSHKDIEDIITFHGEKKIFLF